MPKKTVSTRSGAQRNRPKVQKNIELVRKNTGEQASAVDTEDKVEVITTGTPDAELPGLEESSVLTGGASSKASNLVSPASTTTSGQRRRTGSSSSRSSVITPPSAIPAPERERSNGSSNSTSPKTAPKSGAGARLAARREAVQKAQQRAVNLVSAEHYSYVGRDLRFIAILAAIMFAAIIILHFVPGIGS